MAGATVGPGAGTNYERDGVPNQQYATRAPMTNGMAEHWTPTGTVRGPLPVQETEALTERSMATTADPVPLGLAGFAAATFTVSTILAGWFDARDLAVTIPVLLVFGGIGQFLAGMWSYARGNLLGTVAFGSFGAFNTAFAILLLMQTNHTINLISVPGSDQSKVAGIFILMFALISAYLCYAALGDNLGIAAVLGFLALAYLADGAGTWIGGHNWVLSIGGYAGIVSSILAFYVSAAIVINSIRKREVWPTFPARR